MTRCCIANNAIQPAVIGTERFRRRLGRNCNALDVGLIVLPRRALGESPFTKTSFPCSSIVVAIWARSGVDGVNSAPATSTATGMQYLFMVLLFASAVSGG
jgi:hypothetical protein